MIDPNLPPTLASLLRLRYQLRSAEAVEPGLSGAAVFRCRSSSGAGFALKRWPKQTKRSRIAEVHRVIGQARDAGCPFLPKLHALDGNATVFSASGLWELSDWMPGQAASVNASLKIAESGAAAIASFHRAMSTLGTKRQVAPAVLSRLKRVAELDNLLPAALKASPDARLTPQLAAAAKVAQSVIGPKWRHSADKINRLMNQYVDQPSITLYVLRDVHRDHILFDGHRVTALIDFDAIRIDSPAADLSRWAGSLLDGRADQKALWDAVLAGYQRQSPSQDRARSEDTIRLAKELQFATKWVSLANWAVWLLVEHKQFPAGDDVVAGRILEWARLSDQEDW